MTKAKSVEVDLGETPAAGEDTFDVVETDEPVADEAAAFDVFEGDESVEKLPQGVTLNSDGSVTVPFSSPVTLQVKSSSGTVNARAYDAVTLHRLTGKDMMAIQSVNQEKSALVAMARSARINQMVFKAIYERLTDYDIVRLGQTLAFFMTNPPKTSK